MEPYYNPVIRVIELKKQLKAFLQKVNGQEKTTEAKVLIDTYKDQIIQAKSHIKLLPDKYAFHYKLDGYNELARFINKQLTFGAINIPVNFEEA